MKKSGLKKILGTILSVISPFASGSSFAVKGCSKSGLHGKRIVSPNFVSKANKKKVMRSSGHVNSRSYNGRSIGRNFVYEKNKQLSGYGISNSQYHKVYNYIKKSGINKKNITKEQVVAMSLISGISLTALIVVLCIILDNGGTESPATVANSSVSKNSKSECNSGKSGNLCNNYGNYVSTRKSTKEELSKIQIIANKFNMIPYEGNNCYASTAMCMISDPRDLNARKNQLDNAQNLNFRENEYKKIIDKIVDLENTDDLKAKNSFLVTLKKNIKVLCLIGDDQDVSGDIGEFYKSFYNGKNLGAYVDDVSIFLMSLFSNNPRMYGNLRYVNLQIAGSEGKIFEGKDNKGNPSTAPELSKNPHRRFAKENLLSAINGDTRSIVDCISGGYCLVDNDEFLTDEFLPHLKGKKIEESPYDPMTDKKLTGIKESNSFSVQIGKTTPSETNPFGKLSVSKYQKEDSKRDYLVSEIAVHTGNHWYEDIVIYDKNTSNENCPKIIALIKMNNTGKINGEIITGDSIKSELEIIAKRGSLYRYREIKDDNSNIYAI